MSTTHSPSKHETVVSILLLLLQLIGLASGLQQSPTSTAFSKRPISFQNQKSSCLWSASVARNGVDETTPGSKEDPTQPLYDWDEQFEELQLFMSENGHCNFPQNPSKEFQKKYPTLKRFCKDQRKEYKRLQTNKQRIRERNADGMTLFVFDRDVRCRQLGELGFKFNAQKAIWYDRYHELKQYVKLNGHMPATRKDNSPLFSWIINQRFKRSESYALTDEQIRLLDEIEFPWRAGIRDSKWHAMYEEMLRFQKKHGHCEIPCLKNTKLYDWSRLQRSRRKKGRLSAEQVKLLDEIGFRWEVNKKEWPNWLSELTEYYNTHGHLQVNQDDDPELYDWMDAQRKRYIDTNKKRMPSDEQIERLEELHFCWSLDWRERTWHEKYTEAVEFFKEHGHVRLTKKDNPSLLNWIEMQEKRYDEVKGQKPLSEEELEMLEQIDFPFLEGQRRMGWNAKYAEVESYRDENEGRLPTSHKDDPDLNRWIRQQRHRYRCAYGYAPLSDEQKVLLESFDFPKYPTGTNRRRWYEKYDELVDFWKQNGHFVVGKEEHSALYEWVIKQRVRLNGVGVRTKISKMETYLLERIGFTWSSNRNELVWQKVYEDLVEFVEARGHFPTMSENPKLQKWIYTQRERYKNPKLKLSEYQIEKLEKIGFRWSGIVEG